MLPLFQYFISKSAKLICCYYCFLYQHITGVFYFFVLFDSNQNLKRENKLFIGRNIFPHTWQKHWVWNDKVLQGLPHDQRHQNIWQWLWNSKNNLIFFSAFACHAIIPTIGTTAKSKYGWCISFIKPCFGVLSMLTDDLSWFSVRTSFIWRSYIKS